MNRRFLIVATVGGVLLTVVALFFSLGGLEHLRRATATLEPPQRVGPPGLVPARLGAPDTLWLLTKREERRQGPAQRLLHFDLHGHDAATTQRRWTRRLLTVYDMSQNASARILGLERHLVWLYVGNQPVAVSARDGSVLATSLQLTEANPGLASTWPKQAGSFVFDGRLIVTTTDGLHWWIAADTWRATAYQPPDADRFSRARFLATDWNGGYRTTEFLTRELSSHDGRWIALYSDREAADAADDGYGSHFKDPDGVLKDGAQARRRFHQATVGKTRSLGGSTPLDRIESLTPLPEGETYLQGGMLRVPGASGAAHPGADGGALVLHRERAEDPSPLLLSRVGPALQTRWRQPLPLIELNNRWELTGALLLLGPGAAVADGQSVGEAIVAVNLDDGRVQSWSLRQERSLSAQAAAGPAR